MVLLLALGLLLQTRTPEQLLEDLRSDQAPVREAATRELMKLGESVRPVLQNALKDKDVEVVNRARALLQLLDREIAEGTLRKIQETLDAASTLKCRVSRRLDSKTVERESETTMFLQQGNLARVEEHFWNGPLVKVSCSLVSDGRRMSSKWRDWDTVDDTPKNLNRILTASLLYRINDDPLKFVLDRPRRVADNYHVSDVVAGVDGALPFLTYKVACSRETPGEARIKLWYDPKTHRPLKRKIATVESGSERSVSERVEELVLEK